MPNAEGFHRRSGLARATRYRRPGRIRYAHGGVWPRIEPHCAVPQGAGHRGGTGGTGDAATDDGIWLTEFPPGDRQARLWVLISGGLAATAAFTAAFVAAGGMAGYPVMPAGPGPAVISHAAARPSVSPGPPRPP